MSNSIWSFLCRAKIVPLFAALALPANLYSQREQTGFAFEVCIEPHSGILADAPFQGWIAGLGAGYKITPEYSLWINAFSGPGTRPGTDSSVPRDDFGLLCLSARRAFSLDTTVILTPLLGFRVSTFLLPDGATVGGTGYEVGVGVTLPLGLLFETGAVVAYTYDSYHQRSGPVPEISSFSGGDLAVRFLVRFHPAIP